MKDSLFYLIYVSKQSRKLTQQDIDEILAVSYRNNEENKITGMLLFIEGRFFQVLEGEEDEVLSLYEVIEKDERHQDTIVVARGNLESRIFKNWKMRFNSISEKEFLRISGFSKFRSLLSLKPKTPANPAWMFVKKFSDKSFPSLEWWSS